MLQLSEKNELIEKIPFTNIPKSDKRALKNTRRSLEDK